MHLKRWITGIIAVPILIYLIGFGHREIFYSLLLIISLVGLGEFYKIVSPGLPSFIRYTGYILTFIFFAIIYKGQILLALVTVSFLAFVPMMFYLFKRPLEKNNISDMGIALLGPIYISIPLSMLLHLDRLYLLRHPVKGVWIFFLLTVIFANDTGAFYFGRLFGRHKLYEAVSPGKTWEGAFGGILGSMIGGLIFLNFIPIHSIDIKIISLIFILSVAGQVGDLVESMLKRNCGVKDSGSILPGHGGILDRIDGLLFSIPLLYLFLAWRI